MQRSITQGSHWAARPVPKMGQQPNINRISIHSAHKRIFKSRMSCRIGANSKDEVLRTLSENGEVAIIVVDGTNLVREVSVIRNYRILISRSVS